VENKIFNIKPFLIPSGVRAAGKSSRSTVTVKKSKESADEEEKYSISLLI
jgi:hypothetical protein